MESAKNSSVKLVGANSPEEVERQGLEEEKNGYMMLESTLFRGI